MKPLLSAEIPVTKICVQIKFSDIKFLNPVNPVSICVYIDTSWKITGVKFLQPVSPDSITVLKFATILPDTSRPPNMCYCGKAFDNILEVAAHDTEAHKMDTNVDIKGGQESHVTNHIMRKENVGNLCALFI